ncbi:MAG: hypothetical protein WA252_17945 [Candidatus Sulfotelmatobacter sp.]
MKKLKSLLVPVVCCSLFIPGSGFVLPGVAQQASIETSAGPSSGAKISERQTGVSKLPDSPDATIAQTQSPTFSQEAQSQAPPGQTTTNQTAPNQTAPNQAPADQNQVSQASPNQSSSNQSSPNQAPVQRPVGTAAAEAPNRSGIAASEPAGVAIAPAKQHRARTIIIRTGAIIGAAVALGVVIGLTEATGSKPPGAH